MQPSNLANEFAEAVATQDLEIDHGDAERGNEFAKKYIQIADQLLRLGPPGIEAFALLLQDERPGVRVKAAYYLLPFKTEQSLCVLETIAKGKGVAALGAIMTLARWRAERKQYGRK